MAGKHSNPDVARAVADLRKLIDATHAAIERDVKDILARLHRDGTLIVSDKHNARAMRAMLEELQEQIRAAGYGDLMRAQQRKLADLARKVLAESKKLGVSSRFDAQTADDVKALISGAHRELLGDEVKLARDLERVLLRSTSGVTEWGDLVKSIERVGSINHRQALVKVEDTIAAFHTQTRVEHFGSAGIEWWLFDGPRDERNRDWCWHFVGMRVTVEILNAHSESYGRVHPLPPAISLGGYRCRHQLIPLAADDLDRYDVGPR